MAIIPQLKTFIKQPANLVGIILALVSAYMLFPAVFTMPTGPLQHEGYLYNSLDPSWLLTLNYANNENLVWGSDFAFTYGPLSYLSMRKGWGCSSISFIFYDLFYFFNLAMLFFISFRKAKNPFLAVVMIAANVLLISTYLGGSNALVWMLILVFWIIQNLNNPRLLYYIIQSIIITGLFYIKFNTSLISIVLYYISLSYLFVFRKDYLWRVSLFAVLPLLAIAVLLPVLNVEPWGYIVSGYNFVSGYNEIMHLGDEVSTPLLIPTYTIISMMLFFVGIKLLWIKGIFSRYDLLFKNLILGFVFIMALFVLYKQAFVRADIWHIMEFFTYSVFLMLCSGMFASYKFKSPVTAIVLILVALPIYIIFKNPLPGSSSFNKKIHKGAYFTGLANFTPQSDMKLFPNNNQLPPEIKKIVGNKTVDTYPWNTHMLFENALNYVPRPVMQSYAAYTPYLENLNYEYYNSNKAPQFVLYDYESIDYRYPLFDESKMNLLLLKRYKLVASFESYDRHMLLLEKKENAAPVKLEFYREYAMFINTGIVPQEGMYYEISPYNTIKGKIRGFLKYAPELILEVRSIDNTQKQYKTSIPLLKTGIFSDVVVENTQDFANLLKNDSIEANKKVKYYKINPKHSGMFKEKIRVKEYKIVQ
ncbi:hypothetical protein [Flavobacterium litorale]|uniref:Glycosyltransferase RgtA/B/C/D-like domain-containing protein n=1 Tax=Flavobacterium litorale TaxID=2856519 RepID=A0ABX8VD03_9FLAO|nr:hypothetical protein [Flavobacterium litorale]QYJ69058.1 hypothetical protein K1I41_03995 [Flavobacterium litorale]